MTIFLLAVLFLISVESFSIGSGFLGQSVGIKVNNANQLSMEYIRKFYMNMVSIRNLRYCLTLEERDLILSLFTFFLIGLV